MGITVANLGVNANPDINDSADLASYPNTSWTPPTSGLILVAVWSRNQAGTHVPTISGNGLTWVQIATVTVSTVHRLTIFGALAAGSSAGVTTVAFGGTTQRGCEALFAHVDGDIDLTGGVLAAIVQAPTASDATSLTSLSVSLSAAGHADNRPFAAFMHASNEATGFRTNWTELDDLAGSFDNRGVQTQYRSDAFETTASATWATGAVSLGIALELKALVGGSDTELVVADATHAHTAETPALTQAFVLTVADAGHASGAENLALTQAHLLAVDDATHAHTSETPALTQAYVLAIADATHSHTAEAPALVQAYTLAAQDAEHAHESENVTLSLAALLEVADASHAHTAETPALLQAHTLTVAGAEHLHAAENVTLASGVLLEVADVTHLHAAESPALIQAQLLAVAEVAHAHAAETLALIQAYTLTVAGAAHGHQADNVVLSGGAPYQPAPASRRVLVYRADRRADVVTVEARTIRIPPDDRGSDG